MRRALRLLSAASSINNNFQPTPFPTAYALYNFDLQVTQRSISATRNTDNSTKDFNNIEINNGDLASWSQGGDVVVNTVYNLQGDYNHIVNILGDKAIIVQSGVLVQQDGVTCIFSPTGTRYITQEASISALTYDNLSTFLKSKLLTTDGSSIPLSLGDFSVNNRWYAPWSDSSDVYSFGYRNQTTALTLPTGNPKLMNIGSLHSSGGSIQGNFNNTSVSNNVTMNTNIVEYFALFYTGTSLANSFKGYINTFLIYGSDERANVSTINNQINNL